MPRPKRCRRVTSLPSCPVFKPAGVPRSSLREIVLTVDEFEALRLADHEGLYQKRAAERMSVSRQTFGRIVEAARRKVAQALVEGHALRIEGGTIEMAETRTFKCDDCEHSWQIPFGTERPGECPQCQSKNIHRAEEERGGRRGRRGGGAGGGGRGNGGSAEGAEGKGRQRRRRRGRTSTSQSTED
jgi:uncharacterized protein